LAEFVKREIENWVRFDVVRMILEKSEKKEEKV